MPTDRTPETDWPAGAAMDGPTVRKIDAPECYQWTAIPSGGWLYHLPSSLVAAIEAAARSEGAAARDAEVRALRDAINFDAIPTLLVFAEGNSGVREVIRKLRAALAAGPAPVPAAGLDVACSGCHGRRWVDDENWTPDFPRSWKGERYPGDGLIPCGFCNERGWDIPLGALLNPEPSAPETL